jgi:hypothetical protein
MSVSPQNLPLLGITLIIIGALLSRVYVPWAARPSGALVRRAPLSLLGRMRMHGVAGLVGLAVGALAFNFGLVPLAFIVVVPLTFAVLIALPMSYTLTTEGIAVGRTPMRRWTEFGGVTRSKGGVRLQGVAGARGLTIWLSGSRDDDELVLLLRQLVRGAYQGGVGPELSRSGADEMSASLPVVAFDHA